MSGLVSFFSHEVERQLQSHVGSFAKTSAQKLRGSQAFLRVMEAGAEHATHGQNQQVCDSAELCQVARVAIGLATRRRTSTWLRRTSRIPQYRRKSRWFAQLTSPSHRLALVLSR